MRKPEDERFLRSACRRRGSQQVEACPFGVAEYSWQVAKQMMLLRKDSLLCRLGPSQQNRPFMIPALGGTLFCTQGPGVNHEPMRQENLRLAVSL